MKAYVIKNKEGKYWNKYCSDFSDDINESDIFPDKEYAESDISTNLWQDCQAVEITIAEGDLEKQLAIVRKALLKASKEAFGNKVSFVSSKYPKTITNAEEYAEYLIFETEQEMKNGN